MKLSKSLALLLVAAMLTSSVVSCGSGNTDNPNDESTSSSDGTTAGDTTPDDQKPANELDEIKALEDYDAKSEKLYNMNLGEFYTAYKTAKDEVPTSRSVTSSWPSQRQSSWKAALCSRPLPRAVTTLSPVLLRTPLTSLSGAATRIVSIRQSSRPSRSQPLTVRK